MGDVAISLVSLVSTVEGVTGDSVWVSTEANSLVSIIALVSQWGVSSSTSCTNIVLREATSLVVSDSASIGVSSSIWYV